MLNKCRIYFDNFKRCNNNFSSQSMWQLIFLLTKSNFIHMYLFFMHPCMNENETWRVEIRYFKFTLEIIYIYSLFQYRTFLFIHLYLISTYDKHQYFFPVQFNENLIYSFDLINASLLPSRFYGNAYFTTRYFPEQTRAQKSKR